MKLIPDSATLRAVAALYGSAAVATRCVAAETLQAFSRHTQASPLPLARVDDATATKTRLEVSKLVFGRVETRLTRVLGA